MKKQIKKGAYHVQVLDRTFAMIDTLATAPSGLTVTELSEKLRLHKTTTHRLLMVLESNRYIERDETGWKYHLGSRLMELGLSVLSGLDVFEAAKPHLRSLAKVTGETAHMGILRDGQVVSMVSVESSQTLRTPSTVGTRTPAHCTSLGKALLAFASEEEIAAFLRGYPLKSYTPNTITSTRMFHEELCRIRELGYSIDNEEREVGLRCIAAVVHNSVGEAVAAISIAGPASRVVQERIPACSSAVKKAARRISEALGYRPRARKSVAGSPPERAHRSGAARAI